MRHVSGDVFTGQITIDDSGWFHAQSDAMGDCVLLRQQANNYIPTVPPGFRRLALRIDRRKDGVTTWQIRDAEVMSGVIHRWE